MQKLNWNNKQYISLWLHMYGYICINYFQQIIQQIQNPKACDGIIGRKRWSNNTSTSHHSMVQNKIPTFTIQNTFIAHTVYSGFYVSALNLQHFKVKVRNTSIDTHVSLRDLYRQLWRTTRGPLSHSWETVVQIQCVWLHGNTAV